MSKQVTFYWTSATGMLLTKKHISSIKNLLDAYKIQYEEVDCAVEEERRIKMKEVSGTAVLPQVFVDGKYIGGWEELEAINEEGRFEEVFK